MARITAVLAATMVLVCAVLGGGINIARGADDAHAVSHLTADNLLLIVNKNEPAGQRLAEFYARQRHVPDGRILALDLPKADEISFDDYNAKLLPHVRTFIAEHKLTEPVTCLVTFFGVPLRVGPRSNNPAESAEYRQVSTEFKQTATKAKDAIKSLEELAQAAKPDFKPAGGNDDNRLALRAESALAAVLPALAAETDANRRAERFTRVMDAVEVLYGPLEATQRLALPAYQKLAAKPPTQEQLAEIQTKIGHLVNELQPLSLRVAEDADTRAKVRELFARNLGAFRSLQILMEHKVRLETAETEAAVDNELACVYWPDNRLRYRWHENPLHYKVRAALAAAATRPASSQGGEHPPQTPPPRTLMVMRIDAPTEQLAHDLIATSIRVEGEGLKGIAAFDSRGKPPTEPYGLFDEAIRRTAEVVKYHAKIKFEADDREAVFAPGSVKNVALYCGWYSLRNYVPGMAFNPGAVGYHIASGELISLHNPQEKGWVHGLMNDGVVATLGPVAEPYLHAFPQPDEFFPLLMTGKLKLAEVYWLTNPLVSWMNACIGDPLYTPYAKEPPMKDEDVTPRLRPIFTGFPGPAEKE